MSRGQFTEELKEKYDITLKQLRLLSYFQYLLMNELRIDPCKIDSEERIILNRWSDEGKITFSCIEPCTCTKEFWDWMNDILWDSYVPHLSYTSGESFEEMSIDEIQDIIQGE